MFVRLSRWMSIGSIVVALGVLAGWASHVGWMTGAIASSESTKPNTAICVLLIGIATLALSFRPLTIAARRFVIFTVVVTLLICVATAVEYIFGLQLGLDQALFSDPAGGAHPGRMGPFVVVALVLLVLGLAFVARDDDVRVATGQVFAALSAVIALFAIVGYAYDATGFFEGMQLDTEMAAVSVVVIFALCGALIFALPNRGFMHIICSDNAAGFLVRRLFPQVVLLQVLLGWLCLEGQKYGLYDTATGVGLLVGANVFTFGVAIAVNARLLQRAEKSREASQEELRATIVSIEQQIAERTAELDKTISRLAASELRFSLAADGSEKGILDLDMVTGKFYCSPGWKAMLGLNESDPIDSPLAFAQLMHPEDRERAQELLFKHYKGTTSTFATEVRMRHRDGTYRWMLSRGQAVRNEAGRAIRMVGSQTDISELKALQERLQSEMIEAREAETRLRVSEERFQTIFSSVNEGIFVSDPATGKYIDVNRSGCEMFGYTYDEIVGRDIEFLSAGVPPYTQTEASEETKKAMSSGPQTFEWYSKAKGDRLFWAEISLRFAAFGTGDVVLATARDISERKRAQQQVEHSAQHDELTDLANRMMFLKAIQLAIARVRRGAQGFAILYFDLDHFKDVNDTLGHPVGDLLLQALAKRLKASIREVDIAARFGGDEFAVMVTDIREPADAAVPTDKLLKVISEPFDIEGNDIRIGASIGIAVYGLDSPDPEALLSHADVALYRAKAEGPGAYRFFTTAMDDEVRTRVTMSTKLREAIAAGQLFLLYQPQVAIATGRIVGLEALVRWRHPELGILEPDKFIPLAETGGLITALGLWVMREACRQTKEWLDAGLAPPLIALNMSVIQFKSPLELENDIEAILAEFSLPPQLLELELTESVLMETAHAHNDVLLRLRRKGIRIAIDDFGNGYSSLDYLRRFPVDRIKIARNFIADVGIASGSAAIVRAAINLARELDLGVVGVGVETAAQLKLLQGWGCREVQGFYFAKPLAVPDVTALLRIGKITPPRAGRGLELGNKRWPARSRRSASALRRRIGP
jgi:diguanylate cyclase (GGDEF)-like protein/PAS domain S-box-containing protein